MPPSLPPIPRAELDRVTQLILVNHRRWLGRDLVEAPDPRCAAEALFFAPRVVLCATGGETDHILIYGNAAALALWETTWNDLVGMPSRLTAEPVHRDERERFLARVRAHGCVTDYAGVRISTTGRRFRIRAATVFNILDEQDRYLGQAATFTDWEPV